VALLGMIDGGMRVHFKLPTIMGESVSYDSNAAEAMQGHVSSYHMHGAGRSLLAQQLLGGPCTEAWNCDEGLVCNAGICETCSNDEQCIERNNKEQCFNQTSRGAPMCKHKPLFSPFDISDTWIAAITFVTIMLAAPSGIGGGGILVPMYLAIGKFSPRHGIPLVEMIKPHISLNFLQMCAA
jgi:hypothetical protein